ncbi:MAG TPA: hypothetical protein VH518_01235 [Tepidisphaeraceae bacterium]|jgi:PHD/YefM family antitoxin component YafN of YafNO toxin-antitoxin module
MDIDVFNQDLLDLHRQVANRTGRVVLRTRDGTMTVLISKTELDAMEEALAILSQTEEVRGVKEQLSRIAELTSRDAPTPTPPQSAARDRSH